jgi:hypothetical protein
MAAEPTFAPRAGVPQLSSLPLAPANLFLDFDGDSQKFDAAAYSLDGNPATFSPIERQAMREIWSRLSDMFSPFNLNVTTVDPGVNDVAGKTMHVVFTSTTSLDGKPGNFLSGNYAYVSRINDAALMSNYVGRQVGLAFGLQMQTSYNDQGQQTEVARTSATGSPSLIMGYISADQRSVWSLGTTTAPNQIQDDMATIASPQNGFGFRPDEYGDTPATATPLTLSGGSARVSGVIHYHTDQDWLAFNWPGGDLSLAVDGAQNVQTLNARLELRDNAGNLIGSNEDDVPGNALIQIALPTGTYRVGIMSSSHLSFPQGKNGPSVRTSYGEAGQYTLRVAPGRNVVEAPFNSAPLRINADAPVTVQMEDYDHGGSGFAYGGPQAQRSTPYRGYDGPGLIWDSTIGVYTGGGTGQFLKYTVDVDATGTYKLEARGGTSYANQAFTIAVDGVVQGGNRAVPQTQASPNGSLPPHDTFNAGTLSLTAGRHVLTFNPATTAPDHPIFMDWLRLTKNATVAQTPFPATTPHVSFANWTTIQAEDFDRGGEGVAYHDQTPGQNTGGAYRNEGVDIKTTTDTGGGYRISDAFPGEWLEYTFQVDDGGTYEMDFRAGALAAGGKFHASVDGADVTGSLSAPNTGSYDAMQDVEVHGVNLEPGMHVLRLSFDTVAGNTPATGGFNWIRIRRDFLPHLTLSNEGLVIDENGARGTSIRLNRTPQDALSNDAPFDVSLGFGGTATPNLDYVEPNTTVHIGSAEFAGAGIPAIEDTLVEPEESVIVTLRQMPGYVIDGADSETFWIVDDDGQSTRSLRAVADAYVRDGQYANSNFGNATTLEVKKDATGYNREALLRFDISGFTSARTATLRLFGSIASSTQQPTIEVRPGSGETESTWSETGVTFNNRPIASGNDAAANTIAGTTPKWYEWNVTNLVQAAKAAGKTSITLVVRSLTVTSPQIMFNSDEAATNRPELRVQLDDPVTPPTSQQAIVLERYRIDVPEGGSAPFKVTLSKQPTSNVTITVDLFGREGEQGLSAAPTTILFTPANWNIPQSVNISDAEDADTIDGGANVLFQSPGLSTYTASATEIDNDVANVPAPQTLASTGDAYVRDGASADTNFGNAADLQVKKDATGYNRAAFLKFDLTQLEFTGRFTLRIYGKIDSSTQAPTLELYGSTVGSGTLFNESSITWNNQPTGFAFLDSKTVSGSTGKYYEFDITGWLGEQIASGATEATFMLKSATKTTPQLEFNSREAAANGPELVVTAIS